MAKATVWWFSGTGNSWLVASRIGETLESQGWSVECRPIEALPKPRMRMGEPGSLYAGAGIEVEPEGLDIISFPVYAFSAPPLVDRFLSRMPVAIGRRAAIVATMGGDGYEGRALLRAARRLRETGRKVLLAEVLEMPEAFVQVYPATPPEIAEARTARALADCGRIASAIAEAYTGVDVAAGARKKAGRLGAALTTPVAWAFGLLGRRLLGLTWSAARTCDGCGLCARSCPAKTIRMDGKRPGWGWKCEACQRCANLCPRGAIRLSLPRLVLVLVPCFLPWGSWLLGVTGLPADWRLPLWLAGYALSTALLAGASRLAGVLPGARDFLALSHAGGFRRRLAPGFTALLGKLRR